MARQRLACRVPPRRHGLIPVGGINHPTTDQNGRGFVELDLISRLEAEFLSNRNGNRDLPLAGQCRLHSGMVRTPSKEVKSDSGVGCELKSSSLRRSIKDIPKPKPSQKTRPLGSTALPPSSHAADTTLASQSEAPAQRQRPPPSTCCGRDTSSLNTFLTLEYRPVFMCVPATFPPPLREPRQIGIDQISSPA